MRLFGRNDKVLKVQQYSHNPIANNAYAPYRMAFIVKINGNGTSISRYLGYT